METNTLSKKEVLKSLHIGHGYLNKIRKDAIEEQKKYSPQDTKLYKDYPLCYAYFFKDKLTPEEIMSLDPFEREEFAKQTQKQYFKTINKIENILGIKNE